MTVMAYPIPGTRMRRTALAAGLLLILSVLLAACSDADAGLTRAEVQEIVREEMASQTDEASTPGTTPDDMEGIVNDAIKEVLPPEPGLTRAEVEEIVRAALTGLPSRSDPAEYTQHFVDNAIARYEAQGLDATLTHYNRAESVDGQWYVFIIDENDLLIRHPDAERLDLDLKGWLGTDSNGYEFGPDMLSQPRRASGCPTSTATRRAAAASS